MESSWSRCHWCSTCADHGSKTVPGRKEMFYLTTHSTHFIYGYMASDIWYSTTRIDRGNLLLTHGLLSNSFLLAASSHRQDQFLEMHKHAQLICLGLNTSSSNGFVICELSGWSESRGVCVCFVFVAWTCLSTKYQMSVQHAVKAAWTVAVCAFVHHVKT